MLFLYALLLICFLLVIFYDYLVYKIPNYLVGTILGIWIAHLPFLATYGKVQGSILGAAGILLVGFFGYRLFKIGAGDIKLLSVVALWGTDFSILDTLFMISLGTIFTVLGYKIWGTALFKRRVMTASAITQSSAIQRMPSGIQNHFQDILHEKNVKALDGVIPFGVPIGLGMISLISLKFF